MLDMMFAKRMTKFASENARREGGRPRDQRPHDAMAGDKRVIQLTFIPGSARASGDNR